MESRVEGWLGPFALVCRSDFSNGSQGVLLLGSLLPECLKGRPLDTERRRGEEPKGTYDQMPDPSDALYEGDMDKIQEKRRWRQQSLGILCMLG